MTKENKRTVETSTKSNNRKKEKIYNYLVSTPEGATPKMIALATSINVNTVKSILPKIENIKRVIRGWYKIENEGDGHKVELLDWTFHNLILHAQTGYRDRFQTIQKKLGLITSNFMISPSGKATLRLACDTPLNLASICMVYGYFEELIFKHTNEEIEPSQVHISTIEFNHDYKHLRLDGVKSITLDSLITHFKIYQKKRGLRKEHKTKIRFTAENIIDMLTSHPKENEINTRLNSHRDQLKRLTKIAQDNYDLVRTLINKNDNRKT